MRTHRTLRGCEKKTELLRKTCNNDSGMGEGTCKESLVSWLIGANYQYTTSKSLKDCKCRPMLTGKRCIPEQSWVEQ